MDNALPWMGLPLEGAGDVEANQDLEIECVLELTVSYPLEVGWSDAEFIELVGEDRVVGSGVGFGFRDISFNFESFEEANDAISRLQGSGIALPYCWIFERSTEEAIEVLSMSGNHHVLRSVALF